MQFCAYFSKIRPEAEGGGHQWENVIRNLLHSTEMGQRESPLTKWPDEPEKSSYLQFRIKMGERKQKKSEEKMTILTLALEKIWSVENHLPNLIQKKIIIIIKKTLRDWFFFFLSHWVNGLKFQAKRLKSMLNFFSRMLLFLFGKWFLHNNHNYPNELPNS